MAPFPGIPEDALAALAEPDPLDAGLLRAALAPFADPPDAPLARLLEFGRLLLAANTVVRLTGARSWADLIHQHFLDCLRAAAFVPGDARFLADWGSGAGLPGLVWAVAFPEKRILLLERNGKKAAFLREAALRLELFQAEVGHGQGEELLRREERPDLLVARAVEPLGRLLARLLRNKVLPRSLFLMAGPSWETDWHDLPAGLRRRFALPAHHRYSLEPGRGERHLLVLKPR